MNKRHCYTACLLLFASLSYAQSFTLDVGGKKLKGSLATTITAGTGIRTSDADKRNIGSSFGSNGKPKGGTGNDVVDDGDLNFGKGDLYSSPVKAFSRLTLSSSRYELVLSGRAWSDLTLVNHAVPQGNIPGGNVANSTLGGHGLTTLNRFTSIQPWELYATVKPTENSSIRVGRQVVNWSTARFFLNASHINSLDVTAVLAPGALVDREMDIPNGMIDVKYKTRAGLEIEGFYKL